MYSSVFIRLAWFGDPREWGGLERPNEAFDLTASAGADVAALCKFISDHLLVCYRVLKQRGAIRGSRSKKYGPYAGIKTFVQRGNELGIFVK